MFLIVSLTLIGFKIISLLINKITGVDCNKFIRSLIEEHDYKGLVYYFSEDYERKYKKRIKETIMVLLICTGLITINLENYIYIATIVLFTYKKDYINLKNKYKNELVKIEIELEEYLKILEVLLVSNTVPVAIDKSLEHAPLVFRDGIIDMVKAFELGDYTIKPYKDFSQKFKVLNMEQIMKSLYQMNFGSIENQSKGMVSFSKSINHIINRNRKQKTKDELTKMQFFGFAYIFNMSILIVSLISYYIYHSLF